MNISELCSSGWLKLSSKEFIKPTSGKAKLRIADLFCGCGGLTLGAIEAANSHGLACEIGFAIDNEKSATSVYEANFGSVASAIECADINTFVDGELGASPTEVEANLVKRVEHVDLVLAGPPCQGHSDLNNHSRRKDDRNKLYLRVARFAELFEPKVILIENVRNIVHDTHSVVSTSIASLQSKYDVKEYSVSTKKLGIAQNRNRHILVAVKKKREARYNLDELYEVSRAETVLRDVIYDLTTNSSTSGEIFDTSSAMSPTNKKRAKYLFEKNLFNLPDSQRPDCHKNKSHTYKSVYGRLSWDKPAQTITTGFGSMGQGRFIHPDEPRVLTPHEAARIQGFPDFFDFSATTKRTHLHRLIGNAVPPSVAAIPIFRLIESGVIAQGVLHGTKEEERLSA